MHLVRLRGKIETVRNARVWPGEVSENRKKISVLHVKDIDQKRYKGSGARKADYSGRQH